MVQWIRNRLPVQFDLWSGKILHASQEQLSHNDGACALEPSQQLRSLRSRAQSQQLRSLRSRAQSQQLPSLGATTPGARVAGACAPLREKQPQ